MLELELRENRRILMPRQKRRPGAQPNNANALKHGFYSCHKEDYLKFRKAARLAGLDNEEVLMRVKLHDLVENFPERTDLQVLVTNQIAKIVRTKHDISEAPVQPLKQAVSQVWEEVLKPLLSQGGDEKCHRKTRQRR
jgi:hypothetical protein